eukprot:6635608-Prymnesium_polylepis.1
MRPMTTRRRWASRHVRWRSHTAAVTLRGRGRRARLRRCQCFSKRRTIGERPVGGICMHTQYGAGGGGGRWRCW